MKIKLEKNALIHKMQTVEKNLEKKPEGQK